MLAGDRNTLSLPATPAPSSADLVFTRLVSHFAAAGYVLG
jgi:hypothetical protein